MDPGPGQAAGSGWGGTAFRGMTTAVLVLTTEADAPRAEGLARRLLQEGLAGCISLRPVLSLYPWQGELQRSEE
ncbi:MAG: divalent cation tolerance protein CutA, partial [Cyanobacteriota bacterium]